ncbi:MAG: Ribosomal RNA large subunit methyltransferase H [Thermacetogenium phaeum]|jgi:23S rRNA (pseudouridine1915-N3)-methyltransferase|uniref:Ribosomal RNA large subunit methyltransferase H n=1 Tax=Thermacetogenium phaeum TaxID=85874 RepID=A0A124FKA1_9THEO|nr:MAG: Ribosomal RNA large subunit methyltransferase H [Thermacetogenium phaeum]
MRLKVIAVGHLKEPFYRLAQEEYRKRLQRYARVTIIEVADEPVPEREKERNLVKEREGERLLRKAPNCLCVTLDPGGKALTSEELASWLGREMDAGRGEIAFFLGGTLGLSPSVLRRADLSLSLSRLTFPHQLARIILLEQLYRAFRILRGEPYHY